jgi:hypothetical protein
MSQIAVVTAKVVIEAPRSGQGEMEANPMPDPNATRTTVLAAATKAPAMMDGQDAADFAVSDPASIETAVPAIIVSATLFSLTMRTHRQQQNDRERNAQHPKQYSATHAMPLL